MISVALIKITQPDQSAAPAGRPVRPHHRAPPRAATDPRGDVLLALVSRPIS